ncbi:aromatic amino acid exporter YddG [bacterium BMS3Bbin10]|nr:aromatic amino acid exporter YddG [bacterium BMS3Bbin10]
MSTRAATCIGCIAIVLWSLLALLTTATGNVPPFLLVAFSFSIGGTLGLGYLACTPRGLRSLGEIPLGAWALGVAGLFGYHALYFLALRSAPALQANLINNLWPLLIVLFSALLPARDRTGGLKWWHLAGAFLGLSGTVLIVSGGDGARAMQGEGNIPWLGYGAALAAALVWSGYSVANRRFTTVPSTSVAGFCVATALLAVGAHLAFEETIWPAGPVEWAAVAGLGLGPVGAAFYVWDHGVKHGDLRVLGAAAYAIPVLSTLALVAFGQSTAGPALWAACILITAGAVLAARALLFGARD